MLAADAVAPAGVVVGILLAVPILLASTCRRRRDVLAVAAAAFAGKLVELGVGGSPVTPPAFWIPNRAIVLLAIPAAAGLALLLQRRRLEAERARDAALRERELNRLLMSLLAHDLRAPLVVARQCLTYVADTLGRGERPQLSLLDDTSGRLDRSLRAIELVLAVARRGEPGAAEGGSPRLVDVLRTEAESFRGEAAARGKRLSLRLEEAGDAEVGSTLLVLRQTLAILLDNAIRYAVPGEVVVSARVEEGRARVRVADGGPAGSDGGAAHPRGAGLGLELSRALLANAGGTLEVERGVEGTAWTLTLPLGPRR